MSAKIGRGLLTAALAAFLFAQLLRGGPTASATVDASSLLNVATTNGRTVSIAEIRQKLETAKSHYHGSDQEGFAKSIDSAVAALQALYGDEVPVVEAIKFLRQYPLSTPHEVASAPAEGSVASAPPAAHGHEVDTTVPPDGVSIENIPGGFLIRAANRSIIAGLVWMIFVGLICAVPFIVMGDLVSSIWDAEGLSLWLGGAFLAAWFGGALYAFVIGAVGMFGETRLAKTLNTGEVFTGIGKIGWTHHLEWSDFYGTGDRAVASATSNRFTRTTHYIGLNGTSRSYKFGSDLNPDQQAFIIAYLREHVFGSGASLPPAPPLGDHPIATVSSVTDPRATAHVPKVIAGKSIALERIQQALGKAKGDYHGSDPQGFSRAADDLLASLKAQYGDQVPAVEAFARLEKLANTTGAPIAISF